ncbi:MAG: hypothetical protein AAFX78_05275 [Cyanobacteria bacterium J06638_20]
MPRGDELEALLAATALFFCPTRGQDHPQRDQLQQAALQLLAGAVTGQGVDINSAETLGDWFTQQQLNDPNHFIPQLNQHLESLIADHWVFDPGRFT